MTFEHFTETYLEDMRPRLRENTLKTKETIINKKILPYFKSKKLCEITAPDIIAWQNTMMQMKDSMGNSYSKTYLKTIHNQLTL